MHQLSLIEPSGAEVAPLAMGHWQKAQTFRRSALAADARGWNTVAHEFCRLADKHQQEAECLAMLADFERLAGVTK